MGLFLRCWRRKKGKKEKRREKKKKKKRGSGRFVGERRERD